MLVIGNRVSSWIVVCRGVKRCEIVCAGVIFIPVCAVVVVLDEESVVVIGDGEESVISQLAPVNPTKYEKYRNYRL